MRAGKQRRTDDLVSIPVPARDRREFTARAPDPETAPRDHRARSHDPAPARWTPEEPVGGEEKGTFVILGVFCGG